MKIVEYDDSLAAEFRDINLEWISSMFRVEAVDLEVLEHPRERIIDAGGAILFVATDELGIVGACALMPAHPTGAFELTKMGVRESARGLKAGEFLLVGLTTVKTHAQHLYEKLGFHHDQAIMDFYGAEYERCNVAMRYRPGMEVL